MTRRIGFLLLAFVLLFSLPRFVSCATGPSSSPLFTILEIHQFTDLLIDPNRLKAVLLKKSKIVLVDIRPKSEFEKFRISGSLHMEIYSIKTKNFLKERDVVIIANGYHLAMPLRECKKLKSQGFKSIRVLYGGIQAWINSGGKIEGIYSRTSVKSTFSDPVVLFEERELDDWIVLDLFGEKKKMSTLFSNWQIISINYTKNSKRLTKRIRHAVSKIRSSKENFRRCLAFLDKNKTKKIFDSFKLPYPLFIYNGSISDYESFLEKEKRILKTKMDIERKKGQEGLRKPCGCGF